MSHDAPAFYDASANVMSSVSNRLLCTWHVDRNWEQNLCKIKGEQEKKALVYNSMRVLLEFTSVDKFQSHLDKVLKDLLEDNDTNEFGTYIQQHYSNKPECWAYSFRLRLGINTNMYIESIHKILKHVYLEGKKVKRLDKTINAVLKLIRDNFFIQLIKTAKNTFTEKIKKIRHSHKAS